MFINIINVSVVFLIVKFQFVIPLIIITFCYARILRKVSNDMIVHNEKFSDCLTAEQRICALNRKNKVSIWTSVSSVILPKNS